MKFEAYIYILKYFYSSLENTHNKKISMWSESDQCCGGGRSYKNNDKNDRPSTISPATSNSNLIGFGNGT